jgi:hypothetical protein
LPVSEESEAEMRTNDAKAVYESFGLDGHTILLKDYAFEKDSARTVLKEAGLDNVDIASFERNLFGCETRPSDVGNSVTRFANLKKNS